MKVILVAVSKCMKKIDLGVILSALCGDCIEKL